MFEFSRKSNNIGRKAWSAERKSTSEFIRGLIFVAFLITTAYLATQTDAHSPSDSRQTDKSSANKIFVSAGVEFASSNLPIIFIDTHGQEIPDEPKIPAHMGIIYNGEGIRNTITDPFNNYNGMIGIETRGSSAQTFPKKSYTVETQDAQGNNLNVSLLGFPAENDWVLYGPYSDKSLIRNILAYQLSHDIGRYASRTKCCELVINGEYLGVYVLMEKIKRDKNRVNVSEILPTDLAGDALTGGYIFKIDKPAGAQLDGWESPSLPYPGAWQRIFYQYHYPDQDYIAPQQKAYIQSFISSFESLMNRSNYADPQRGYSKYIAVDSFVDFFILSEIAKNVDAYRLSTFFYKDRDSKNDKLFIGPIWDFNLAFGNVDYYGAQYVSGWQADFLQKDDFWQNPFWWQKLLADSNFAQKINSRWHQFRKDVFTIPHIYAIIDSLEAHLDEARKRNFERWQILGKYIWPNAFIGGSYPAEIRYLKFWIQSRILWMDARMPGQYSAIHTELQPELPTDVMLKQNCPNPFNETTTIGYALPANCHTRLAIWDIMGCEVKLLVDAVQLSGLHYARWDGTGQDNQPVSSGVYIIQFIAGKKQLTRKLLLLR
jgi:hypothetical protein